jgi:hypothetical protein
MSEANFPLVINFQGDYGMKLLMVDPTATLADVIEQAKQNLIGVVLKPLPAGVTLEVRRHREAAALDPSLKVGEAGLLRMEALDIVHAA